MFSFFRKSQDSKRVMVPEREADGFILLEIKNLSSICEAYSAVLAVKHFWQLCCLLWESYHIWDTTGELKTESNNNASFPERGTTYNQPLQKPVEDAFPVTVNGAEINQGTSQTLEGNALMPELLSDIPFTLAPHILIMQSTFGDLPDQLLMRGINDDRLSRFHYDFSLENSVLCDP